MPDALTHFFGRVVAFVKHAGLWWGIAISVALAVASLAVAAAVVISWSPEHFKEPHRPRFWAGRHPALRILGLVGKNVAGVIMFLLGLVMAFPGVPGQGFLTMIIAVTLIDFPGKHELERRLVGRPWVLRQLNAIRRRFNHPPLEVHLTERHHTPPASSPHSTGT
jgi:hypothetical protein